MSAESVPTVSGDRVPRLPITIGQVARFASASFGRVMSLTLGMALVAALVVAHFMAMSWWPAVRAAAAAMPDGTIIRDGRLVWPGAAVQALAENRFLAITAVPRGAHPLPTAADLSLELREDGVDAASLLGYTFVPYPRQLDLRLTSRVLTAQLDAWHPHILAWTGLLTFFGLIGTWLTGGMLLALPLLSYSLLGERRGTFLGCWRLAIAAFVPGTLLGLLAVLLYTYQQVALVEVLLMAGVASLLTVLLLVVAPLKLPQSFPAEVNNPDAEAARAAGSFSAESAGPESPAPNPFVQHPERPPKRSGNPFAGSDRQDDGDET
jgi:hypothetical protein